MTRRCGGSSRTIFASEGTTAPQRESPAFSLGVQLGVDADESGTEVIVEGVAPGSAAARDGLEPGDRLISADGTPLGEDPLAVIDPLLRTGRPIRFKIERRGSRMAVEVTPAPKS